MQRHGHGLWFACAAIAIAGNGHAANYQVGVYDGYFGPSALNIYAGDSITFTNVSDLGPKNVHALDESFRCSVGCRGDGSGATGDPSKARWTDTLTFNNPGDITFVSDQQVSEGEIGKIHVTAAPPGPAITPGFSGNWSDPSPNQGGHGLQIEVLPDNGILVIWFVFNPAGNQQSWIYMQGAYDPASNSTVVPAYLEQGGAFPPKFDATKLNVSPWGVLRLTFTDCDNGIADWSPVADVGKQGYSSVTFPIHRVTRIAGMSCP